MAKVIGAERLNRKLNLAKDRFQAVAMDAMTKSADEIVAMMKRLAPVEDGDLRDSIGWTFGDPPQGARIVARSKPLRRDGTQVRITIYAGNDEAFYARWVEFGTKPHTVGKGDNASVKGERRQRGARHPGARAQPFFFPSWRLHRKRLKGRVTRAINKAAKEVAAS